MPDDVIEQRKTPPNVITDLTVKALGARKPRPRYYGGTGAGQMLFLRHILSNQLFDRLILALS